MFRCMISASYRKRMFKLRNSKLLVSVLVPAKHESELLLFHFLPTFDVPGVYFGH